MNKNLTEEEFAELRQRYKLLKSFLEVDESLQKQGVWGFIPVNELSGVMKFVRSYEEKILGIQNDN